MARRRGGGGRQERTKSPASGGGVHPAGAQQRGAPGAAQRAGLHPVAAGLQGRDAPRHPGAEADAAAHPKRGDDRRGAEGGPTGPAKLAGPHVSDPTGSADETAAPARLERSGRRARSGRDGVRRCVQATLPVRHLSPSAGVDETRLSRFMTLSAPGTGQSRRHCAGCRGNPTTTAPFPRVPSNASRDDRRRGPCRNRHAPTRVR